MSDALSRNTSALPEGVGDPVGELHGAWKKAVCGSRGKLPGSMCRYVLETRWAAYISMMRKHVPPNCLPQARLLFHPATGEPLMKTLRDWMEAQFAEHLVEPNSGNLSKAITYFRDIGKGLTAFLRDAGAPLDNNICERALKRAVLHRIKMLCSIARCTAPKVGDLFMSLIHTCELNEANPLRLPLYPSCSGTRVNSKRNPSEWMPWNYHARRWRRSPHVAAAYI